MRDKNRNIQGGGGVTVCGKRDFPFHKELLLKERFRSLWERREQLIDPVVPFDGRDFISVLATTLCVSGGKLFPLEKFPILKGAQLKRTTA